MTVSLSLLAGAGWQFFDDNGNPLSGGLLYTYEAGTTTPQATYTDSNGNVANSNPIVLDAAGRVPYQVWLTDGASYKFILKTSLGVTVWTEDDVPAFGSSADIVFLQAGAGAVTRTVQSKLRDVVSVKDFGAVGDGVTDDTSAFQNAVAYCVANGYKLRVQGKVRITQGSLLSTNYRTLEIVGETYEREDNAGAVQSQIILDSASDSSYFFNITGRGFFIAKDIAFKCAQAATPGERKAIIFNSNVKFLFDNVDFENVDRFAIYFENGCYFQTSALRNCQFRGTGNMIGSASNALKGTGLVLDNIQCASNLGAAATKVFCDLRGVREIVGYDVIWEGGITQSGWTIVRFDVLGYESEFSRATTAQFFSSHIEWSGTAPAWAVQQNGGTVCFSGAIGFYYGYQLTSSARTIIEKTDFTGTAVDPTTYFSLSDLKCQVIMRDCMYRLTNADVIAKDGFIFENLTLGFSGEKPRSLSGSAALQIFKWNGGIWAAEGGTVAYIAGGNTLTNSTDATYGRKLVITPSAGAYDVHLRIPTPSTIPIGAAVSARLLVKLPTFTGGAIRFVRLNFTNNGDDVYLGTALSGQVTRVFLSSVLDSVPSNITYGFNSGTATGLSGTLEILGFEIFAGNNLPVYFSPLYPANITTWDAAVPTTGTWARGDRVFNNTPTVGQPKSWVCTVAGTPGTWVSEGNL